MTFIYPNPLSHPKALLSKCPNCPKTNAADTLFFAISDLIFVVNKTTWVKVFRIIPEFRILRLTFHRKSALNTGIRQIIIAFLIYLQFILSQLFI